VADGIANELAAATAALILRKERLVGMNIRLSGPGCAGIQPTTRDRRAAGVHSPPITRLMPARSQIGAMGGSD